MTIEELLDMPSDDIRKMSDEELTVILTPHFPATRPHKRAGSIMDVVLSGNPELAAKLAAMAPVGTRTKLNLPSK